MEKFQSIILAASLFLTTLLSTFCNAQSSPETTASFISQATSLPSSSDSSTFSTIVTSLNPVPSGPRSYDDDDDNGVDDLTRAQEESDRKHEGLLNYYFVFLALLGIFVAVGIYLIAKRRKKRKLVNRNGGQSALARDLTGWPIGPNRRRWMHGTGAFGNSQTSRREEGLNEHGEAPPPYVPKAEEAQASSQGNPLSTTTLTIPLQTLSRDGRSSMRPPNYEDTVGTASVRTASVEGRSRSTTIGADSSRGMLQS